MKKQVITAMMAAVLVSPMLLQTARANGGQSIVEQADLVNWVANTPEQINNNMQQQHIDVNNLNGTKYVVQWGDTLSQISAVTNISVAKLAYDNNIKNVDLIYVGQVLILNRNGNVPTNFKYQGNGQRVASTTTNLTFNKTEVNFIVSPVNITSNTTINSGSSASESSLSETSSSSVSDASLTSESSSEKESSLKKEKSTTDTSKVDKHSENEILDRTEFLDETVNALNEQAKQADLDLEVTTERDDAPENLEDDTTLEKVASKVIKNQDENKFKLADAKEEATSLGDLMAQAFGNEDDTLSDLAKKYHHIYIEFNPDAENDEDVYNVYAW
ncbi:MAG: LysM peptidoglycan-binding domain-containing protein [Ligilactobacillus agilis]|nr:LysM peptidoglycan-binding domain-containing protein [Ligilactobacillus agilis]